MVTQTAEEQSKPAREKQVERPWPPRQGEWTYEDWLRLPSDGWRYEVIKGVLHMTAASTPKHQRVSRRLERALEDFIWEHNLGELLDAPVDVMLPGQETPVEPDIIVIPADHPEMIGEKQIEGAPLLVVEVLSPSNWWVDRREKVVLYAETGVQEYWIVDPDAGSVEVFVLREGTYALLGKWGTGETARSEVLPGFEIAIDAILT